MFTTVTDYYAAVARLGLRKTPVAEVFAGLDGMHYSVPAPGRYTPDQRARIIEVLTIKVRGYEANVPSNSALASSARKEIHGG